MFDCFPIGFTYKSNESVEKTATVKDKRPSLIFVGDSRVQMWDTTEFEKIFQVINIGHGGQTTAQTLLQINRSRVPIGDWMILQTGINDIHSIGAFKEIKPLIMENCKANIKEIVQRFQSRGYQIILTTLFPASDIPLNRRIFWDRNSLKLIQEINLFIKELSAANDIHLVDAFELLKNENKKLRQEFEDHDFFLHVNPNAYKLINEDIFKIINYCSSQETEVSYNFAEHLAMQPCVAGS